MGKATGQSKNLRGKIGQMIYYQRKDGTTVVYEAKEKAASPVRTEAQMQVRTQWSNLGAVYTQFHKTLKKGFEGLEAGLSDYNAFIQANVGVCKVYIPKWIRLNGGCVLAPYLVTRGKMPSVAMSRSAGDVLVSNIALGALVIGDDTTVGELSSAVLAYNATWQEGDQLTFFYGTQEVDEVTGTPRALISGYKVVLDVTDTETLLWNVVTGLGFTSVVAPSAGYVLGMGGVITDGACAWIHSREGDGGSLMVSTQYLFVDSSVLESYQTNAAFVASVNSYGGINMESAFLDPRSSRAVGRGTTGGGTTGNGTTGTGTTEPGGSTDSGNGGSTEPGGTTGNGTTEPGGTTGTGTTGTGTTGNGTTEPGGTTGNGTTGNGTTEPGGTTGTGSTGNGTTGNGSTEPGGGNTGDGDEG